MGNCDMSKPNNGGEPREDTISRQAAIDAIGKDVMGGLNYAGILTRLPSVTPKQKVGKWIYHMETWPTSWYSCSICDGEEERTSNYCPNCGAKMVEPQKSGE